MFILDLLLISALVRTFQEVLAAVPFSLILQLEGNQKPPKIKDFFTSNHPPCQRLILIRDAPEAENEAGGLCHGPERQIRQA